MINPLQVASDGYLNCAARTLSIAVAGYLCISPIQPPHTPRYPSRDKVETFAPNRGNYVESPFVSNLQQQILQEDEDILIIIHNFLQTQ